MFKASPLPRIVPVDIREGDAARISAEVLQVLCGVMTD